jgi:hypothetical protein
MVYSAKRFPGVPGKYIKNFDIMDSLIFDIIRYYCPLHRVRQPGTKTPFGMIATLRLQITI